LSISDLGVLSACVLVADYGENQMPLKYDDEQQRTYFKRAVRL